MGQVAAGLSGVSWRQEKLANITVLWFTLAVAEHNYQKLSVIVQISSS